MFYAKVWQFETMVSPALPRFDLIPKWQHLTDMFLLNRRLYVFQPLCLKSFLSCSVCADQQKEYDFNEISQRHTAQNLQTQKRLLLLKL